MPKVLLVGFVCSPDVGSEPGLTWRWATHLVAHNDVWVICHPQYRQPTEAYLAHHPIPRLHFHYVDLPAWRSPWKPEKSNSGVRLHYLMWQRQMLCEARRLHTREHFDVAHQVGWTTVTAPTPLWKLPIPAVWGPVGGAITTPDSFLRYFGGSQWTERLRTLRVNLLPFSPAIRNAARHLAVTFATNLETVAFLKKAGARDVRFLTDQGLLDAERGDVPPPPADGNRLELVWVGRLEHRKALPIVIEALALLPKAFSVRLRVAGDGPLKAEWEALATRMGVASKIEFLGFVNSTTINSLMDGAHALVFSSLRDAFGTVVMEAMTRGRPVITLDHQGIGAAVPASAAIKIPVTTPKETVRAFAEGIRQMADPALRQRLSEGARIYLEELSWLKRAEDMTECYRELCGLCESAPMDTAVGSAAIDA